MIPASFLRQLYVQGSLVNTPEGVKFKLRRPRTATATVLGLEISIDGNKIPTENINAVAEADETTITLKGINLTPGSHKIDIKIKTKEWGDLVFDVTDTVK